MISFSAPGIASYRLPFSKHPIVTDVTHKAVSKDNKYLCLSVIYVPELKKRVVFFQAIIGGLDANHFATYFIQMFEHFKIGKNEFLGVAMDYSSAQRLGFLHAFNYYFYT